MLAFCWCCYIVYKSKTWIGGVRIENGIEIGIESERIKRKIKYYIQQVMLLGDSGVGKTCLLVRFRDGKFLSGNYITTVGIDFRVRNIYC